MRMRPVERLPLLWFTQRRISNPLRLRNKAPNDLDSAVNTSISLQLSLASHAQFRWPGSGLSRSRVVCFCPDFWWRRFDLDPASTTLSVLGQAELLFFSNDCWNLVERRCLQVWCSANTDVLVERAKSRPWHPGHAGWDEVIEQEFRSKVDNGNYKPLDIGGSLIMIDINDFGAASFSDSYGQVLASYAWHEV